MTPPNDSAPPPQAVLIETLQGFMAAKALTTVAELAIADHLADGPKTVVELAGASGSHPESLHRLLRALATQGIFREDESGRFANTPLSEPLRRDVPGSIRDYALYVLHEGNLLAWNRLADVMRTGQPSFASANAKELFPYLAERPDLADRFDRAMTSMSFPVTQALASAHDFSQHRSIVDIGGGRGHVLAAILGRVPTLRGVLFDQSHVLARARALMTESGLLDRVELVEGDFFDSAPRGHDAYLLKHIVHDWDDERALRILRNVRGAMPNDGTLLVIDAVIESGNRPQPAKWLDLQMMVVLGGKERSEAQHAALFAQSGFRLDRVAPISGTAVSIVIGKPA